MPHFDISLLLLLLVNILHLSNRPHYVHAEEDLYNTHRRGERERARKCMNGKCSKFLIRSNEDQFTWKSHAGRREIIINLLYFL